jgi:hypothetical protein
VVHSKRKSRWNRSSKAEGPINVPGFSIPNYHQAMIDRFQLLKEASTSNDGCRGAQDQQFETLVVVPQKRDSSSVSAGDAQYAPVIRVER